VCSSDLEFRGNPGFLFDLNRLPYTEAFCSETTVSIMCGLRGAIYTGISTGSPEVLSSANVVSGPDGSSELTLEIPFDFIGNRNEFPYHPTLLPIPSVQALNLPELLAGQPIMIHLWLTAEGEPVKVEANGEMTADGKNVRFQAGWEKLREATIADFPEPPSALDVTYLTAEEASQLTNRIIERQEELSE
jgi:hypothetical protein